MYRSININKHLLNNKIHIIRSFSLAYPNLTKVALVLSGCGVYDGTEIHEASSCLIHLSRAKADVSIFAPDINQMHVVDHLKGSPHDGDHRNVLEESARIARGNIQSLDQLKVSSFDAVVFPGGFGAAKNLSDFAVNGANLKVNENVSNIIKEFHANKKPIGLCCIAPVLVASVLKGCEVTVGYDKEENGKWPFASTAAAIQELGAKHVNKNVNEVNVDDKNLIVTTPAFMAGTAPIHEIYDGIGLMISKLIQLVKKK